MLDYKPFLELFDIFKGIVILVLAYYVLPIRKKIDNHAERIAKMESCTTSIDSKLTEHIADNKEDFKEIKIDLKEIVRGVRNFNGDKKS